MQNINLVNCTYFCIKTSNYIVIKIRKMELKFNEFFTHQIPPNLKFCLSPSKEKKDLFVLKQLNFILKDIFCYTVQSFLIPPLNWNKKIAVSFQNLVFN